MNCFNRRSAALRLFLAAFLGFSTASSHAIETLEQLQQAVRGVCEETDTAAAGIAVIDRGRTVWVDALGLADIEQGFPATPDTLFRIGSTSKMFVGLSVLRLVDEGRLDLDATVRELAPEIVFDNPWEAGHPVRLVHLLEHTSGWDDLRLVEYAHNEQSPIALKEALLRHPGARTSRWVPGTRMAYSNAGPAVAAYIVEKVTGMVFEDYVTEALFLPLGMEAATYFPPIGAGQRLAIGYANGEALGYWHMMHRPAGAVNASATDMANLLRFFLDRGLAHGDRVVSEASIERMETSLTTLGAAQGITQGYGLANYPSGFRDLGLAFRGHAGGLPGATADLAYVPELGSGYAIMLTGGDGTATHRIGELIREYLTRDHAKLEPAYPALPGSFRSADGIYVPINPRSTRDSFLPQVLGAMRFSSSGQFFHRMPVLGGWDGPSSDYAIGENLLVDQWSGLPTVAKVFDPVAGDAIQVGADTYVKSSAVRVWGEVVFLVALFACSAISVIWALIRYPVAIYRHRAWTPAIRMLFWPTLSGLLLLACASRIELSMARMDMTALGRISPLSIMIFGLTAGYGLVAVWGAVELVRQRSGPQGWARICAIVLCGLHLVMALHLARHGMIGLRTWTV